MNLIHFFHRFVHLRLYFAANVDIFEDGSVTFHPLNAVPFHLKSRDIKQLSWYQTGQTHDVALLTVEPETGALARVPAHIRIPPSVPSIAVALYPRSTAWKQFLTKVIAIGWPVDA